MPYHERGDWTCAGGGSGSGFSLSFSIRDVVSIPYRERGDLGLRWAVAVSRRRSCSDENPTWLTSLTVTAGSPFRAGRSVDLLRLPV